MKESLLTLAEAAAELGLSKETLRNWDRRGKLKAVRNRTNNYRMYREAEVRAIREQLQSYASPNPTPRASSPHSTGFGELDFKRMLARLHRVIRDVDGRSSLLERLDEVVKLLFLKIQTERVEIANPFDLSFMSSADACAELCRKAYREAVCALPLGIPVGFDELRLSDEALARCAEVIGTQQLSNLNVDIKGIAFEEMIRNTFDKTENQQFFTPRAIAEFMVSIVSPFSGPRVLDPASGTGGFLIEAVKRVPEAEVHAWEIDARLAWITQMNLLVHGAKSYSVICSSNGGSLSDETEKFNGEFDTIITNPPFGSDFTGRELESYALGSGRKSRRRGVLFLEKCLNLLKEDGLLGIILDDGVFSQGSNEDVRRFLLNNAQIIAIVSLPPTAFQPYASVNSSILFCRRRAKPPRNQTIFFGKADAVGRKANGDDDVSYDEHGRPYLLSDLPLIADSLNSFMLQGATRFRTDKVFVAEVNTDCREFAAEGQRLDYSFHHPARRIAKDSLAKAAYPLVPITELVAEVRDSVVPSVDLADQLILYTGLANIEAYTGHVTQTLTAANSLKSACKRYSRGDILFSRMRPNLRKVGICNFDGEAYASAECLVLRPRASEDGKPKMLPELLEILLKSDLTFGQVMHLVTGIGRPRLNSSDFRKVLLPLPPLTQQEEMVAKYRSSLSQAANLRERARHLMDEAGQIQRDAGRALAQQVVGRQLNEY